MSRKKKSAPSNNNNVAISPEAQVALNELSERTGMQKKRAASLCILAHAPKVVVTEKEVA